MTNFTLPSSDQAGSLAVAPAPVVDNEPHLRPPLLSLYFAFQIVGGHIGFPLLLAVVFVLGNASSRHPLFINFCVIWIVYSVSFCLLLYTGHDTGPGPPFMICAIQASLVYAMPIMASVSLSAMVFQLWLCLRGTVSQAYVPRSKAALWGLVALPYLVAIPYIIFSASVASVMPDRVSRHHADVGSYCSISFQPLRTAVAITVAISLVLLLVWESLVARIFYMNWKSVRTVRVYGWTGINLLIRIAIFTLYILVGIAACAVAIVLPSESFRILFQASIPIAAFFLFATRPNLWKRDVNTRRQSDSSPSNRVSTMQGSIYSHQESTLRSLQSSKKNFYTTSTRSNSTEMAKTDQGTWGNTIRSKVSTESATERKCSDRGLPALPLQAFMPPEPRDIVLEGNAPTQDTVTWGPDATKKGSQDIEAHGAVDVRPTGGPHPGSGWI